jgi:hypothetical protein
MLLRIQYFHSIPNVLPGAIMDPSAVRTIPLHLAMFGIISPSNAPLYVHSYTGPQDELRYHHLAHASLDIFEERGRTPE